MLGSTWTASAPVGDQRHTLRAAPGVLETALEYAASGKCPKIVLRFGFWVRRSSACSVRKYYGTTAGRGTATRSSSTELRHDASPNAGYFIYDDNPAGQRGPRRPEVVLHQQSIPDRFTDPQGPLRHAAFRSLGIPTAGTFPVPRGSRPRPGDQWGGTAKPAFDACYHQSATPISNLDLTSLDRQIGRDRLHGWNYAQKDYGRPSRRRVTTCCSPGFESGATNWTGTVRDHQQQFRNRPAPEPTRPGLQGNGMHQQRESRPVRRDPRSATAAVHCPCDPDRHGRNDHLDGVRHREVQIVDGTTTTSWRRTRT